MATIEICEDHNLSFVTENNYTKCPACELSGEVRALEEKTVEQESTIDDLSSQLDKLEAERDSFEKRLQNAHETIDLLRVGG